MRLSSSPRLRLLLLAAGFAASLPLVAGFLGHLHPALDSFAHFRIHLAILLAVVGAAMLLVRLWPEAIVAVVLAAASIWTTWAPAGFIRLASASAAMPAEAAPAYRLLQINLLLDNPTPEAVLSLIARLRPDVVTLQEVSPMWRDKLDLLEGAYPYSIVCEAPWQAVAILSRRPFETQAPRPVCLDEGALAIATFNFGGQPVDVAALHLKWPWPFGQAGQIEALAEPLGRLSDTAILAGDLNAAPWSAAVTAVARHAGMTRIERIGPTWLPGAFPPSLTRLGLPIDQVMSKGAVSIRSTRLVESVGSDHLPLLIEFSLAPGGSEPERQTVEGPKQRASTALSTF